MFSIAKFSTALLLASQTAAYVFNRSASLSAVNKMRTLSAKIYSHEITGSNEDAGIEIFNAILDMQTVIDDIPGAGYILNNVFPGDSDTK